jgi:glc operon protein GlcG
MTRKLFATSAMLAIGILLPFLVSAQGPPPAAAPAGGPPGGGRPPIKQYIDLATAKRMVAAAEAAATAANAKMGFAVVDANGDLVYFERMDGAAPQAVTSCEGKARAAVLFGMPTKDVQDAAMAGKQISAMVTIPPAYPFEVRAQQGGLPIIKDGKVVGGIGGGGSAPANDEKFAQAGLDAISGK